MEMGLLWVLWAQLRLCPGPIHPVPSSNPCPSIHASQRLHTAAKARPVLAVGALVVCSDVLSC